MAKKQSVTPEQKEEIKALVVQGIGPQKIADQYGVAVSTVHNYKRMFKQQGTQFESVRGRQPAEIKPAGEVTRTSHHNQGTHSPQSNNHTTGITMQNANTFVVNGIPVTITNQAKSVNINKTNKGITFEVNL